MGRDLVVTRSVLLNARPERVWEILTHPHASGLTVFNCNLMSDWQEGSDIHYTGTYQKQDIDFHGRVIQVIPGKTLRFTLFDPHAGNEGYPENYIHVSYTLLPRQGVTGLQVSLSNFNGNEMRAQVAAEEWDFNVLPGLKSITEAQVYFP